MSILRPILFPLLLLHSVFTISEHQHKSRTQQMKHEKSPFSISHFPQAQLILTLAQRVFHLELSTWLRTPKRNKP